MDVGNTSCVSDSWNLENDMTHGQTGSTIHRSKPPADQSGKRVASCTEKSPDTTDTRDIRAMILARVGRIGEDATRKLIPWNLILTRRHGSHRSVKEQKRNRNSGHEYTRRPRSAAVMSSNHRYVDSTVPSPRRLFH